ncbi:bifunctional DNA-formamidopyrimidine glycosylase/DNA [Sesbania bispinosa]|nr:bifunctional DNA-formamidopyrimidine glycosylase/DNA [Sesbania bispinosa]
MVVKKPLIIFQKLSPFRWWSLSLQLQVNGAVVRMGLGEKVIAGGRIDGEELWIRDNYVGLEGGETMVSGCLITTLVWIERGRWLNGWLFVARNGSIDGGVEDIRSWG